MKWCFQSTKMEEGGSPLLLVHCADDLVTGRRLKMATTAKRAVTVKQRLIGDDWKKKKKKKGGKRRKKEGSWKWW